MRRYGIYISKVKFKSGFVMQMETWAYTQDEARENITRYIDTCLQYTYDTIKEEPFIIEHGALTEKVKVLMTLRQYQRTLSRQFRYADLGVIKEMVDVVLKLNSREIADIYNSTSCQLSERQRAIKTARKAASNLKRYEYITDGVPYQTEVFITEIKTER